MAPMPATNGAKVPRIQPASELAAENFRSEKFADVIVDRIAENGSDRQEQRGRPDVEIRIGAGAEDADGEEQGIARQNWRDDEAGFAKDDCEQQRVGPDSVFAGEIVEVLVEFEDEFDELTEEMEHDDYAGPDVRGLANIACSWPLACERSVRILTAGQRPAPR